MTSIQGGKAIALANKPGAITPLPGARVYRVAASGDGHYTVVVTADPEGCVCTCPAGQAGRRCYHLAGCRIVEGRSA